MLKSWKFWRNTLVALAMMVVATFGAASVWINGQNIDRLEDPLPQPSLILDVHGEPASQLSGTKMVPVSITQMSPRLLEAIVAVEDQRFWEHGGVDATAMARAFFRNTQAGGVVEGASTITQQLAKNLFLSSEQTYDRKLKEVAIAMKIEQTYTKQQILEMYLNQIYFGEGAWGVQQAAKTYFGVDASELTLAQSALLAALPKAPSHYSPFVDPERALERRNLVLALMRDQGQITEAELQQAQAESLELNEGTTNELNGKYQSYVNHVMNEAESLYGLTEEELLRGGYRIYTNLDPKVQQAMEGVYEESSLFPESPDETMVQSGAVILDPRTGGIRGIVGRRGEPVFRGFNYATQLKRQPGSAIKPIAVYAPALEEGYTPGSMLVDEETDFDGYRPRNADRRTRGEVTLEEAVKKSYNIPAVWLLDELGIDRGLEMIHQFGLPTTERDRNLSVALGGLDEGVSPLQMAAAYAVFANEGRRATPHAITRIERKDGSVLVEAETEQAQVVKPETAYAMTELLQGGVEEGTGRKARLDRPTAGKTGTTQLPDLPAYEGLSGSRDTWFVGYTPELVAAVWMGYDQTDATHYMTSSGGDYPAQVFQAMMTRALEGVPASEFAVSEAYEQQKREEQRAVREARKRRDAERRQSERAQREQDEAKRLEQERQQQELLEEQERLARELEEQGLGSEDPTDPSLEEEGRGEGGEPRDREERGQGQEQEGPGVSEEREGPVGNGEREGPGGREEREQRQEREGAGGREGREGPGGGETLEPSGQLEEAGGGEEREQQQQQQFGVD